MHFLEVHINLESSTNFKFGVQVWTNLLKKSFLNNILDTYKKVESFFSLHLVVFVYSICIYNMCDVET